MSDTRTITVEQLAAAGFEPDQFVCARCHHHGSRHDVNDRCLDCIEQVGPDYFVSMTVDEAWDWGFAALPAACCCIEGNDIMLTTCATNDCPEHGTSEADRLVVAMVDTFADGAGVHEGHAAIATARAYLVRKGLA